MSKKTVTKKTTAKKTTTKSTAGVKAGAAPAKSSKKKSTTKSGDAKSKSAPNTKSNPQKPAKPVMSKNLTLGGPARLGSSFGMPSHPPALNLSSQTSQKKKKNQNPIAAAVEKQFGASPSGKAQGNSSAQGATRSQMRRDTKKG